jgi:bifunctional non-homologous end joining protein LigD
MDDPLEKYKSKRDFSITPEPAEGGEEGGDQLKFVIQKHWATRLHSDFRLELGKR